MKILLTALLLLLYPGWSSLNEPVDGWKAFAKVEFEERYNDAYEAYFYFPLFGEEIKSLEGKEVSLRGYCMPFEMDNGLVLSKNPYSSCFFCGGAGPETVAEVYFSDKAPRFRPDQFVHIKGTLRLNAIKIDRFNFIIEDAVLLKK